jgi:CRP/FNR family transcriptional regulator, cyclic AMP receptor protein
LAIEPSSTTVDAARLVRPRDSARTRPAAHAPCPDQLTRAGPGLSIGLLIDRVEDRMTLTQDRRTELLAACPLFKGIDAEGLAALAERAASVDFPAGHVIAREGEIGTGFFVIVDGGVRVVRDGTVVARLGPGEFFGELSVLDRQPRNATVSAEMPTSLLALASWDFEKVLLEQPALTLAILRGVATRLREVSESVRH